MVASTVLIWSSRVLPCGSGAWDEALEAVAGSGNSGAAHSGCALLPGGVVVVGRLPMAAVTGDGAADGCNGRAGIGLPGGK